MIHAIFKDDSLTGNICLRLLSVGFATLNQRLNLDYPLNGDKSHSISFAGDKRHTNSFTGINAIRSHLPRDKSMSEWGFPQGNLLRLAVG